MVRSAGVTHLQAAGVKERAQVVRPEGVGFAVEQLGKHRKCEVAPAASIKLAVQIWSEGARPELRTT